MTQDVTTLVLGVDSSAVKRAGKDLDGFAVKGREAQVSAVNLSSAVKGLGAVVSVGAVAALAKQAIQTADAYTNMTSRLSLVTKGSRQLAEVQRALFDVSQNTRADLEQTTGLYTALARSTETLGVSQRDLIGVTESINKALVISGTSATSAQAALMQLGQAFGEGALRGDELISILGQAPRLAQAIADGMGVPVGKLRELGTAGEITAEKLFRALQASGASLTAEFEKMPATVGGSVTRVSNSIIQLIGTLDKLTGTSSAMAGWASQLSVGLDGVNSRVQKSGGLLQGYFDSLGEGWATARLQATREELDRMAGAVKRAQTVLASQPDSIFAKNTLREFQELTDAARKYEAEIKRIRGIDVSAKEGATPSGGRQRDISGRTVASVSAALAREQQALAARKEFLKDYATAEEKFTAELKKQKELQGDLFTAADEERLREKFLKKTKADKASIVDPAKNDLGPIQRQLDMLTNSYADAERVLEATRSAGLINERAYYAEKLIFLELNTAAQVKALQAENETIAARARRGQKGADDDDKVADNLARIDILQKQAATSAKVMSIEQEAAAKRTALGYVEARIAAQAYIDTVAKQFQREREVFGRGDRDKALARQRSEIEDRYQGQRDEAQGERRRNEITEAQLRERLALITTTQAKELALWTEHYEAISQEEADWSNGAATAIQNYLDQSSNVAEQMEGVFTKGFKTMEDALVSFAMTGKMNFKDLANSIIADLIRIQARAAISGILRMIGNGASTGDGGAAGGDAALLADMGVSGGRAIGGPVSAGAMYQVNERGPELLNVGSKQYLMTGGQGGSVSPMASGPSTVNHINVAAGPSRNEVLTAIQMAVQASEARTDRKLAKVGV
jgi:lambda family phage tail tape measure protein